MAKREVSRAVAFCESTNDLRLLQELLRSLRARVAAEVRRLEVAGKPTVPPTELQPADRRATKQEAVRTVRSIKDLGELQAISKAIGHRAETIMESRAGNAATET